MTVQLPNLPDPAMATPVRPERPEQICPPLAPLAMPKQILTPEPGVIRRAFAALAARVMMLRPTLRRAD